MLKKECCIKCCNDDPRILNWYLSGFDWIESNEEQWEKRGCVICPESYLENGELLKRKTRGQPPGKCPYYLENIL